MGPPDTVTSTSDATGNEIWSYAARELSSGEKASMVGTRIGLSPLIITGLNVPLPLPLLNPDKKCEISFDNEGIVKSMECTGKLDTDR